MELLKSGVLWHLLMYMFNYDYTLDEGGIEKNEESNKQEVSNRLAKESIRACSSLGGYVASENQPPPNMLTRGILESLLTPYLSNRLGQEKPEEVMYKKLYINLRRIDPISTNPIINLYVLR